jgi:hypothetical protein
MGTILVVPRELAVRQQPVSFEVAGCVGFAIGSVRRRRRVEHAA